MAVFYCFFPFLKQIFPERRKFFNFNGKKEKPKAKNILRFTQRPSVAARSTHAKTAKASCEKLIGRCNHLACCASKDIIFAIADAFSLQSEDTLQLSFNAFATSLSCR